MSDFDEPYSCYDFEDNDDDFMKKANKHFCMKVIEKGKKMANVIGKHYVGSQRMSDGTNEWYRKTQNEAVEHAKELIEEDDSIERLVIVKVVAVVERKKQPIVVRTK